jgi:hypothetical protein
MGGGTIGVSTGCSNEISNRLNAMKPGRVRGGNWIAIERKEAMDLLESFKTHKLANVVNPPVVISDFQWVQAKMNVYA